MNNIFYAIVGAALGLLGLGFLASRNRQQAEDEEARPGGAPSPEDRDASAYSIDEGEGLSAILDRAKVIDNSPARRAEILADTNIDFYKGITQEPSAAVEPGSTKRGLMRVIAQEAGNPEGFPVEAPEFSERFQDWLQGVRSIETSRPEGWEQGREWLEDIKAQLYYAPKNISLWPENKAIVYGTEGWGPADEQAYLGAVRQFAANAIRANLDYQENLRKAAIQDLVAAGWKFRGINA